MGETVNDLFARAVAAGPTRPLLTWYDDGTGERIELSGATLENWVAKTANLLVDGCGLGPGDRAAAPLPPHWQTAAVLLGCWAAGLSVAGLSVAGPAAARSTAAGPAAGGEPEPVGVLFSTAADGAAENEATGGLPAGWLAAGDRFALGFAPLGAPLRQVPAGFADYVAEVRGHGDRFTPYRKTGPGDAAQHGPAVLTHGELCAAAADRAGALGLAPGARVLIDAARHPEPLDWLLAPLAADATIVLVRRLDPAALAARLEAERVTVALTAGTG